MKFSLFLGCNIPARVEAYELSARAVSDGLGIQIADIREFKCCGNPIRNIDHNTFLFMAARNLALAEKQGSDMMVLCKCCFGSLKKAAHIISRDPLLEQEINARLAKENLEYKGRVQIKHFLSILYHDIGIKAIQEKIIRSFKGLDIATHYGCHALRPSDVTQFDDPVAPVIFDELVKATGSRSIDWPLKLECCGAPLLGVNDALSINLTEKKLASAGQSGAAYMCVACPYCQMQFETAQRTMAAGPDASPVLPSVLFPQILGLAMGIDGRKLGIHMNHIDISGLESFLE